MEQVHLVAVSIDGKAPSCWPEVFAKMVRHLNDIRAAQVDFDQFEIVLRVNKGKVTAMGPTPFRPDRWDTRNAGGGVNLDHAA